MLEPFERTWRQGEWQNSLGETVEVDVNRCFLGRRRTRWRLGRPMASFITAARRLLDALRNERIWRVLCQRNDVKSRLRKGIGSLDRRKVAQRKHPIRNQ